MYDRARLASLIRPVVRGKRRSVTRKKRPIFHRSSVVYDSLKFYFINGVAVLDV